MKSLVLVHGFMGGSEQWGPQAELGAGRELIKLDLPGFGRSAHLAPIASVEGMARWALGRLTELGVAEFDLLGHSMGGMIVQEMVRLTPDRVERLVLYATAAVGVLPNRFETIETSMQRAERDGPGATARRISATWFLDGEDAPEYPQCAAIAAQSSADAIQAGLGAMRGWSGVDHLPRIGVETLIVWGDRDRTYGWPQVEQLWTEIPEASLSVLPRCAHAVHLEKPSVFNEIVQDFLRK